MNYPVNLSLTDPEASSQFAERDFPRNIKPSDLFCLIWRQLAGCFSSLSATIFGVFFGSSKEQVIWSNAWGIIASVKNIHCFGDWSVRQQPTSPVRKHFLLVRSGSDESISAFGSDFGGSPNPTRFRLSDLCPKAFWKSLGKSLLCQVLRGNVRHSSVLRRFGLLARPALLFCLLTVFSSTLFAQPNPINRRAVAIIGTASHNPTPCIASFTDPSQLAGLAFRWVASDQTNTTSLVDRVQGNYWVQNTGGNKPTLNGNHLDFNGTSSFFNVTNVTLTFETNCSYYLIISTTNNGGADERFFGPTTTDTCQCYLGVFDGGTVTPVFRSAQEAFVAYTVNKVLDFVYAASLNTRDREYTNGIIAHTNVQASVTLTTAVAFIGKLHNGGLGDFDWFKGAFYEMGVYTNTILSPDAICSLHYYATNKYGFTP